MSYHVLPNINVVWLMLIHVIKHTITNAFYLSYVGHYDTWFMTIYTF